MVLKPSELTPLTALAMAELGERAGIPLGVLNVVVGDAKAIGDEMIKSDEVKTCFALIERWGLFAS